MGVRKELAALKDSVEKLSESLKKHEIERVKEENAALAFKVDLIGNVKLKVRDFRTMEDNFTGKRYVMVRYDIPTVRVEVDQFNRVIDADPAFKAINYLNLISYEDMARLGSVLEIGENTEEERK